MKDQAQIFYQKKATDQVTVRPHFAQKINEARAYYKNYIQFVSHNVTERQAKILDLGCGEGWSTLFLKELGFSAHGIDLHKGPVEANAFDPDLVYLSGDGQKLPIQDSSYDAVAMYQVLGHIPDPQTSLEECVRVLKENGVLIIVGPNLISFPYTLYWSLRHTMRCLKKGKLWEKRTKDLPSHPGGNTMPESWKYTVLFFFKTIRKLMGETPVNFWMRDPDTRPPFFSNNDACYYSNPMDIVNWARSHESMRVIRKTKDLSFLGSFLWPFRAGMWLVVKKAKSKK